MEASQQVMTGPIAEYHDRDTWLLARHREGIGSSEVPIILGVRGEAAEILAETDAGIAIEPDDSEALCNALISLREDRRLHRRLSNRARAAAAGFDRTRLAEQMLGLLDELAAKRDRS